MWFYGQKLDVSHFRVFGCTAYVDIQKDQWKGLSSHTEKSIFIGYPQGYKGWLFYNPLTKIISNRTDFDECVFPGLSRNAPPIPPPISSPPSLIAIPLLDEGDIPDLVGDNPQLVGDELEPVGDRHDDNVPTPSPPPQSPQSVSQLAPTPDPAPSHHYPLHERKPPGEFWKINPKSQQHYGEPTPLICII